MSEFVRIIDPSGKTIRNDLYNSPPDTVSYIIFEDGGLIKAKNGRSGQIEFCGSDAATVIQQAINALTNGGLVFVKSGTYIFSTAQLVKDDYRKYGIYLKSNVALICEKETVFKLADGLYENAFTLIGVEDDVENVLIEGVEIDGNYANNNRGSSVWSSRTDGPYTHCGIKIECMHGTLTKNIKIRDVYVHDTLGGGIIVGNNVEDVTVKDCRVKNSLLAHLLYTNGNVDVIFENVVTEGFYADGAWVTGYGTYPPYTYNPTFINVKYVNFAANPNGYGQDFLVDNRISTKYAEFRRCKIDLTGMENVIVNVFLNKGQGTKYIDCEFKGVTTPAAARFIRLHEILNEEAPEIIGCRFFDFGASTDVFSVVYATGSFNGLKFKDCKVISSVDGSRGLQLIAGDDVTMEKIEIAGNLFDVVTNPLRFSQSGTGVIRDMIITDNRFLSSNIWFSGNVDYYNLVNNYLEIAPTLTGTHIEVEDNIGYVTENSGTATIPAGSTSVTVSHGLAAAPSKVLVTPIGDPGDRFWVANIGSSSFDIVVATAPAADIDFYWQAEV